MSAPQGADERRIRHLLAARGVGYAPQKPPPVAGWWDDLYDDAHDDHHSPDRPPRAAPRLPDWRRGQTVDLRGPDPDEPQDSLKEPAADLDAKTDGDEPDNWEDVPDTHDPAAHPTPRARPGRAAARRAQATYADLAPRTRWLLYNGTAASAGWGLGAVPLMSGWITACGHDTSTTGALALAVGLIATAGALIDRRTRHWWPPLAWACRIPLASALLALALYAPGATP